MIRNLLSPLWGSEDESGTESDDEQSAADPMPINALIGLLRDIQDDISHVDFSEEQYNQILPAIEDLHAVVPGNDDEGNLEAYPIDERVGVWIQWIASRLKQSDIEHRSLHIDIEQHVFALEDAVDEMLPAGGVDAARDSEYQFTELDTSDYKGHESIAEGITYDTLARVLKEFREDHQDIIDSIDDYLDNDHTDTTKPSQPTPDGDCPSEQGHREDLRGDIIDSPDDEVGPEDELGEENEDDSEEDVPDEEDEGIDDWKVNLLLRDPDPEYVSEETITKLEQAGYITSDGRDPHIDVFAGPHARDMMEVHSEKPRDPVWVGHEWDTGIEVPIEQQALFKHQFVVGKTGSGKTNYMGNQFRELMAAGYGGLFVDPNGDVSKRLIQILPEYRLDDVIWIEPGGSQDYATGINFLEVALDEDDPLYDTALEVLVDDLVKMIGAGDYWGQRMDRIAQNMIRAMNKSPHDFNLLDMYYILGDETSRQVFSELIQDQDLDFIALYNREIAKKDQDEFDSLLGRLQKWAESGIARQLISFRESPINIADAVENDKIIIVRMGQETSDLKQMLSMAILRRVWSVIRRRSEQESHERKPFFLFMDEFDNIVREGDQTIPDMLGEARKYRLSVTAATQHPKQIPEDTREDVYGNTDVRIGFKLGHIDHARAVAPAIGLDDPNTLIQESDYNFWTMLESGRGETTEAFRSYALPPYPPLRSKEEAENLIQQSLREHGVALSDQDIKDALKFRFGAGELERRGVAGNEEAADSMHEQAEKKLRDTLFEAIYVTQIKQDTKGGFVPMDAVEDEWKRRAGDLGYQSKSANVLERTPDELVSQDNRSDGLYVRVSPEGLKEAGLTQDTGANASGGGPMHRWVLSQAFEAFTVWDCFVDLPDQGEGGELPDGLADLPIDPLAEAKQTEDPRAFQQALNNLSDGYPRLYELTEGRNIAIEAETSTIVNPQQTLTNLRKAVNEGKFCVFAVKPPTDEGRSPDDAPFNYWVQRGEQLIYRTERSGTHIESINREEVTCVRETTPEGHRRFYNGNPLILSDNTIPLRSGNSDLEWWEQDGEIIAREEGGEIIARFDSVHTFAEAEKGDFPAYATNEGGTITVYHDGETEEYEDQDMMEQEWSYLHEPFIPELEFDDGLPSPDDFAFVVFPLGDSAVDEPMVVDGDEQYPLLPEDRSMPTGIHREDHDPSPESDDVDPSVEETAVDEEDEGNEGDHSVDEPAERVTDPDASTDEEIVTDSGDVTPIESLEPGSVTAIVGEIQSYSELTQVATADSSETIPMRSVMLKDETGKIRAQLWDRHADYHVEEGEEVFIGGASVEREIRDGVMGFVVNVEASSTLVPAPETMASTPTSTSVSQTNDSVAVTDGAVNGPATDDLQQTADDENEPSVSETELADSDVVDDQPENETDDISDADSDTGNEDDGSDDEETLLP